MEENCFKIIQIKIIPKLNTEDLKKEIERDKYTTQV